MPCRSRNGVVPVSFIEQNPLALRFLLNILKKDPTTRVLRIEELAGRDKSDSIAPVIVVDNCGLPLPLSECLRRLRFNYPDAKYVILDHKLSREDLLRLLWMKIDGFLPYSEVRRSLLTAVLSVARDNIWVPREILREYVQHGRELHQKDPSDLDRTTSRETQIIELVKRRLSNKEIGDILGIRESTVKFHLSNIYSKYQVGSRHELIGTTPEISPSGPLSLVLAGSGSKA